MGPTRDPPQDKRPTQIESAGLAKIFQSHGEESKNQGRNTSIRQNRFLKKSQKERQKQRGEEEKHRYEENDNE